METFQNTVTIGRLPEEVFAFLADFESCGGECFFRDQARCGLQRCCAHQVVGVAREAGQGFG